VPVSPDNPACAANEDAWRVFERWEKPFICCYSDGDPITRGLDRAFRERVPGARGQRLATLSGGHFMQEDDPQNFAQLVVAACATQSAAA
jgi:haloalkane dehalogenase